MNIFSWHEPFTLQSTTFKYSIKLITFVEGSVRMQRHAVCGRLSAPLTSCKQTDVC
jgi:hypothetical protein